MSPQAHARVDEKHFEMVDPTFSNTVGEFRKSFTDFFITNFFSKLQKLFVAIFLRAFATAEKQKSCNESYAN